MADKKNTPYIRTEFKLEAIFQHRAGGETTFKDVVGISATFALNTIPTAILEVPAGVEVVNQKLATIHSALKKLEPRDRCLVYLDVKSTSGFTRSNITDGIQDGKILIFDGYYSGMGYSRSNNHFTYAIHLLHWLDDLNCSSLLNGDWSPAVPHDLAQIASEIAISDLEGGGGVLRGGTGPMPTTVIDRDYPSTTGRGIVNVTNMEDDLWENVLKKIFSALAKMRHPRLQCEFPAAASSSPPPASATGAEPAGSPADSNSAAAAALDRMPGKAPTRYRAKLPLNLTGYRAGEPFSLMSLTAHNGLYEMIKDGMGHNSFWSKLVGDIAPSFLFAISPSVEFAQAIPFFGGLTTPHKTIKGDEYNYANFNVNCARMVSCVAVHWPAQGSGTEPVRGGEQAALISYCSSIGKYPTKSADYRHHWGNIMVRQPPPWLMSPVYKEAYTRANHFQYNTRSALDPQAGPTENPEAPMSHTAVEDYYYATRARVDGADLNVYDRFAAHLYKSTILGQRVGELSGKLRFDIAPGSIVKIEAPITEIGSTKTMPLYGAVVGVSFVVNAEQHTAGTSFTLSHMRTEKENDITNPDSKTHYVGEVPPLYRNATGSPWPGGPLVPMAGDLGAADAPTGTNATTNAIA